MLSRHGLFAGFVVTLTFVLEPDLYGLIPNSLDPIFYTGYATNLGDALAAAGNKHYFVTRWSSYLPQHVFCSFFGPYWGRLILRLAMLSVLFEMFWQLGSRFRFHNLARTSSALVVVFSPMFIRAFTTDYQEYTATFYGTLLVGLVVSQPFNWKWGIVAGTLSALLVISNPFTFGLIAVCSFVWFVFSIRNTQASGIFLTVASFVIASATVVVFGYLLFRYHYRIGNVYEPTIRFIREFKPPSIDLWTTPGKVWVGHFSWLYIPGILLLVASGVFRGLDVLSKRIVHSLCMTIALVFLFHLYMQLSRGHALETSYYWAMALPPVYVLLFLILGKLTPPSNLRIYVASIILLSVLIIRFEAPQKFPLGANIALIVGLLIMTLVVYTVSRLRLSFASLVLTIALLWIQLGSPNYDVLTYGGDLNSPRYDLAYGRQADVSNEVLREVIWFNKQMDLIADDWKSSFLSAGGWSSAIVATYVPHPFSRWIVAESQEKPLPARIAYELEFGSRKYLTVFGDLNEVKRLLPGVRDQLSSSRVLLDRTHDGGLRYRLVVLAGNVSEEASAEISLALLDRTIGTVTDGGIVEVSETSANGYATFGPYFTLTEGRYRATIEFESGTRGILGRFEAYRDETKQTFHTQLVSDGSGPQESSVDFTVGPNDGTWQIRTEYFGAIGMRITRITLDRLAKS